MGNVAICIINSEHRYELDRCLRYLEGLNTNEIEIFYANTLSQLKERKEQYIAFLDVYDIWNSHNIEECLNDFPENGEIDIFIHSYWQRIGRKNIPYFWNNQGITVENQILLFGIPGLSSMIIRNSWLLELMQSINDEVELGSYEFGRLLEKRIQNETTQIKLVEKILSEHWSYYGKKTPSIAVAKCNLLNRWKENKDEIVAQNLFSACYNKYQVFFPEYNVKELFDAFSMNETDIISFLEQRENWFSQQLHNASNALSKKNDFYSFMCKWVELHQAGLSMADILKKDGIKTIAIYGAGKHGKMLLSELQNTDVSIEYWIDKAKKTDSICEYSVMSFDEELPMVDAIIVTPYHEFEVIRQLLQDRIQTKIISLSTLVER